MINREITFILGAILITLTLFLFGSYRKQESVPSSRSEELDIAEDTTNTTTASEIKHPDVVMVRDAGDNVAESEQDAEAGALPERDAKAYKKPFASAPDREQYRREVAADPHDTPPSLLAFAAEMAQRMTAARSSESTAVTLFEDLETCALATPEEEITAVRLTCQDNAATLAKAYPALFNLRWNQLRERLEAGK